MGLESEFSAEHEGQGIEALPERLGLVESPELAQLRAEYVAALVAESAALPEIVGRYRAQAEAVVNQSQGEAYKRAQLALIIGIGLIQQEAGRLDRYREELEDALTMAQAEGFDDVVPTLIAALR